jgi:glycosyltransferase involved in cell wall biosynthesis
MRHLLLSCDAVGGVWQYSTDLARALEPHGYQVTLAVMGPAPDEAQRADAATIANLHLVETGLELEWLAAESTPVLAAEARLAEMAGDLRADIVQLHTPALVANGRYSCPVIAVQHSCVATWWAAVHGGPMPHDFAWRTDLVARGLKHATLAITPSAAFAQAVRRVYGVIPVAVHNGRDIAVPAGQPMKDHVFTAGRLWDEGKNVHILDEAATRLSAPFFAAGSTRAPHGAALVLDAITPLGNLDAAALAERLSQRPVFASAALYEPFGLAVLEAAIAGCALVLSDIETFRELWDGAAIFVDPRDPAAFARAIEQLLQNRSARIAAGQAAQDRARRYSPAAMAAAMAAHYATAERRVAA